MAALRTAKFGEIMRYPGVAHGGQHIDVPREPLLLNDIKFRHLPTRAGDSSSGPKQAPDSRKRSSCHCVLSVLAKANGAEICWMVLFRRQWQRCRRRNLARK